MKACFLSRTSLRILFAPPPPQRDSRGLPRLENLAWRSNARVMTSSGYHPYEMQSVPGKPRLIAPPCHCRCEVDGQKIWHFIPQVHPPAPPLRFLRHPSLNMPVIILFLDKESEEKPRAASYHPLADLVFQLTVQVTATNMAVRCRAVMRTTVLHHLTAYE